MIFVSIKKIIKHFGLLSIVQLFTILFPLFIYMVLIKRLSIAVIGEISTWQMFFYILASLSSYSFPQNLIPISEKLKKSNKTVIAFWNKFLQIKFLVLCFVGFLIIILYNYLPKICIFSSFLLLGKLYNPSSFFYVLAKNKALLWFNFFSKFFSLAFVFLLVTNDNWFFTNFIIGVSEFIVSILVISLLKWPLMFSKYKLLKIINYVKKDKKLFYIQFINTLILSVTIPFIYLIFGNQIAGIIAIIEKVTSFIRGVSGNLFFAILPNFENLTKHSLYSGLKKSMLKIAVFSLLVCFFCVGLLLLFKDSIYQKFEQTPMLFLLTTLQIIWFPILMSTPFQMFCIKTKQWSQIFLFSKVQLVTLLVSLFVLGHLFGIWGIIVAIILPEIVTFFLFKNEASKKKIILSPNFHKYAQ